MADLPSGTVTFLFTDIEGSTALWERDRAAMAKVVARHLTLLDAAIEAHGGVHFKTVGDAVQSAFETAPQAVSAAVDAQQALLGEAWEAVDDLQVRMAVHAGEAEPDARGDYLTAPLNRLSRLLSTGHGGQILLTHAVQQLTRGALPPGAELRDLGEHRLRDLLQPERVWQVLAPGLPATFPPLRTLEQHATNLPVQLTPFIGRERDITRIVEVIEHEPGRLVTLTGPGGTGKTRLALAVAAELLDAFPDGVWFVDLSPLADHSLVIPTIASTLGLRGTSSVPQEEMLTTFLRDKLLLLVLDNFEHLLEAAPVVSNLLRGSLGLKVLVTSRAPLRLRGEQEAPIAPLDLPDPLHSEPPEQLAGYEAIRLFIERAHAVHPDFTFDAEAAPSVTEICWRLDGLPLAIELAAARIRMLSPAAMLTRLERRLPLLTGGARDAPERQRALRNTIAWSHDLLPPENQALFRRLGVFAGGWTLEAAEAVANPAGELDVFSSLERVVEQSLVRRIAGATGDPRFGMLETVREFALERLEASGEAEQSRRAHAAFLLSFAEGAELSIQGSEQSAWLDRLEVERDNFRGALAYLAEAGDHATEVRLATALWPVWYYRGPLHEGASRLEAALSRGGNVELPILAAANARATLLHWTMGASNRAIEHAKTAVAQAREVGDLGLTAWALYFHALVLAWDRGEWDAAIPMTEEAVDLARAAGPESTGWLLQIALGDLGTMVALQGDPERGALLIQEALDQHRALGHHFGVAVRGAELGLVDQLGGRNAQAAARYAESLRLLEQAGDVMSVAMPMAGLVGIAAERGLHLQAARLLGMLEALRDRIGVASEHGPPAVWYPVREQGERLAREALGAAAFTESFEAGRALPLAEARAEALALTDELAECPGG
jgi:predicted ATPase/class 3 adenylate cyclase